MERGFSAKLKTFSKDYMSLVAVIIIFIVFYNLTKERVLTKPVQFTKYSFIVLIAVIDQPILPLGIWNVVT